MPKYFIYRNPEIQKRYSKMDSVQIGRLHKHVGASHGPDNNIMKFYITEYSSRVGIDGFKPREGQNNTGTGYNSNFRPGVYYSRKLDELDNPEMGHIVSKNYCSQTQKDYQKWKHCAGTETLPSSTSIKSSGFGLGLHRTVPSSRESRAIFPDLVMNGYKKPKPLLHSIKNKNSLDAENNNLGPAYFSTENHTQFTKKNQHVDTSNKVLGPNKDTGFTKAKNSTEPVSHYPESSYQVGEPLKSRYNPIGDSTMKASYRPLMNGNGKERFPCLSDSANLDNGFTRYIRPTGAHTAVKGKVYTKLSDVNNPFALERIKKEDPAEYTNMTHPHPHPSFSVTSYDQKPLQGPPLWNKSGKVNIGKNEGTGHTHNNKGYHHQRDNAADRFNTMYDQGYYDKSRPPNTEFGRLNDDSVREPQEDGYTKSEKLHPQMGDYDVAKQLGSLHPYVNRSLKARDPFYGENKYAHKQRSLLIG